MQDAAGCQAKRAKEFLWQGLIAREGNESSQGQIET